MARLVISLIFFFVCVVSVWADGLFIGSFEGQPTVTIEGKEYVPLFYYQDRPTPVTVRIARDVCGQVEHWGKWGWQQGIVELVKDTPIFPFANVLVSKEFILQGTDWCPEVKFIGCVTKSPLDYVCKHVVFKQEAKCQSSYFQRRRQWNGWRATCIFTAPCFETCVLANRSPGVLSGDTLYVRVPAAANTTKQTVAKLFCGGQEVAVTCQVQFIPVPSGYRSIRLVVGKAVYMTFWAGTGYKGALLTEPGQQYQLQRFVASKYGDCKVAFAACKEGSSITPQDFLAKRCPNGCTCSMGYSLVSRIRFTASTNKTYIYFFNRDPNVTYNNLAGYSIIKWR